MQPSSDNVISTTLVDESFAVEDDRFVERVRGVGSLRYLAGLADRWKRDPRPWARQQIFVYLEYPLDRPGHHPLVKRLFKQAEANDDRELMAVFLVAFDRLVRRKRRMRYHYNWQTRELSQEEVIYAPGNQILANARPKMRWDHQSYGQVRVPGEFMVPKGGRLFSYTTRAYLRRRAARYFRRLGFMKPGEYVPALAEVLVQYVDDDFEQGENILDNWSLMQLGFRRSPVLTFTPTHARLAEGKSLSDLAAAPRFEHLWAEAESRDVLLSILARADSRLVRVWSMQLLKRLHGESLTSLSPKQLQSLLDHDDEEVQSFAAGLLGSLQGIESWPIATWLELLETRSVSSLALICEAMQKRVTPERLTLEQCVDLICARATPVARMGLAWLKERPITSEADRAAVARLSAARCDAIGAEAAQFALANLGAGETYRLENVTPFFDSLNTEVRRGAWEWLTPESPGYNDAALWSRLLETPYSDVRLRLIEQLGQRQKGGSLTNGKPTGPPALRQQELTPIWTSVLLGVQRGGRAKLTALRQISAAIAHDPTRAEPLLPVLAVAIRSVRPPEARAGLASILSAVAARPELEPLLAAAIPELRLTPQGGTA